MLDIYIDADACPVKDEIFQVAGRYGLHVFLVANSRMRVPPGASVELILVDQGADVADDWIAEHVQAGDVTVTADVPLAARCVAAGAAVLGTDGRPFDSESIGSALAMRDLRTELRESGTMGGGPPPLSTRARSRFLSELDRMIQSSLNRQG